MKTLFKLFAFSLILMTLIQVSLYAQTPKADKLYLQGNYVKAALEYLNSPSLQGEAKLLAHFKAARAYLQSTHEQDIESSLREINFLLGELDADTELFARTLHLRILANFKLGHLQKSLQQLESGKARLFKHTTSEARGVCEFLYKIDQNPGIAKKCRDRLTEVYPKAWVLDFPLNLTIAKKDLKLPSNSVNPKVTSTNSGQNTSSGVKSSATSNTGASSELDSPSDIPAITKSSASLHNIDPTAGSNGSNDIKAPVITAGFNIQVGAFGNRSNAEALSENLAFLKKNIVIIDGAVGGSKLYLVQMTGFSTKDSAEAFARNEIAPEGLTYRVISN